MISIRIPPRNQKSANDNSPTPERLQHANDNFIVADGTIVMQDAPIDRLHKQGFLSKDSGMNDILHKAARSYYDDYQNAGLSPLGAFDYTRPIVDSSTVFQDRGEKNLAHTRWNGATKAMKPYYAAVVDRVVLLEQPLVEVGRFLSGSNNTHTGRHVALARLIPALEILAVFYGLADKRERA